MFRNNNRYSVTVKSMSLDKNINKEIDEKQSYRVVDLVSQIANMLTKHYTTISVKSTSLIIMKSECKKQDVKLQEQCDRIETSIINETTNTAIELSMLLNCYSLQGQ